MVEIYLGNVNDDIKNSGRLEKGFIHIEEHDKKGIALWHWFSAPFSFNLIDGGFGYAYILKYDGSSILNDPNIQYWKIYVSFLREGTYSPTTPSLDIYLEFLTTGSFVQFGMVPKAISNTDKFDLSSLIYGGFLVRKEYTNTTARNFYILDNNGNYKSKVTFGPEFNHYNMFRRNGTLLGIKKQTGNKLEILLKPLLRLNNQGVEYDNPAIESTMPAVNE
ncbi:hypothetical protein C1646_757013, partial [Rhizophagus diaphanus]